jgi:hypothetical protein
MLTLCYGAGLFGLVAGAIVAAVAAFLVHKYRNRMAQDGKELEIPSQNMAPSGPAVFGAFAPSTGAVRSDPYMDQM